LLSDLPFECPAELLDKGSSSRPAVTAIAGAGAELALRSVRQAVEAGDHQAIQAVAHNLKSSSYHVGATQFGDLCQAIEDAGGSDDVTLARRLFEQVTGIHTAVVAELQDLLTLSAA